MSENNLPVLWVPPVPPQAPENRPPRASRRPQIVTLAALLIGTPILAWATMTGNEAPAVRPGAAVAREASVKPSVPQAEKVSAPLRLAETSTSAGPATSGGSQPYLTDAPTAAKPKPEAKPAKETSAAPAAVDAEGRAVRVIDMNQRADGDGPIEPKPVTPPVAAAPRPAAEKPGAAKAAAPDTAKVAPPTAPAAKAEPSPAAVPSPAVAAKAPVPAAPSELRSTIDTPPTTAHTGDAAAVAAPKPADTAASSDKAPAPAAEIAAKPAAEKPAPVTAAPKPGSGSTSVVTVAPPATPAKPTKIPAPRPKETTPALAGGPDAAARSENRDFADRLAAVRRDEGRRLRAAPPPIDDDEAEIVVVPRRGWSIFPSFEDEVPARPVLRPFDPPPRVAERPAAHSNCHFHAWPTEEMEFHRDVQCHWHRHARDTSLRYVR
jgi:hypothetical protein